MSLKIKSPFTVIPRLSEINVVDADQVSLKQLRDAVAGTNHALPRARAMDLLLTSDFPNVHRDFQAVLRNEDESPVMRSLAALYLAKLNTPSSLEVLLDCGQIREPQVLAAVIKALGRIGDRRALDLVLSVEQDTDGPAATEAGFAAALIAHRLGLPGHDLPIPAPDAYADCPSGVGRPFQLRPAGAKDAELCLRSLANQSFGIELAEDPMYRIHCGRNDWMLVLNHALSAEGAAPGLREKKALAGLIAAKNKETKLYSVAFLLLTAPEEIGQVSVVITRPDGQSIFAGGLRVQGNRGAFSIRALVRPGAYPMELSGELEDGQIQIAHARSGAFAVVEKRHPQREHSGSSD